MSDEIETLTVDELIAYLTKFPYSTKVYMSKDEEGNSHSTTGTNNLYSTEDGAIILYPHQEQLEYDEICPISWDKLNEEEG